MTSGSRQEFRVPDDAQDERLDRVLAQLVPDRSRSRLQKWIKDGAVRLDGEVVTRSNTPVAAGGTIELTIPQAPALDPARGELQVLFEDEHMIVIDKQAGLVTHANSPEERDSVAVLAAQRYGPLPDPDDEGRGGVVHRLDRMTSGVLVLARTSAALEALKQQFKERTVAKTYVAVAAGDPRFDSDWIETSIAPVEGQHNRFKAVPPDAEEKGREASSFYQVRERFDGYVLLTCEPKTGRTHQIRVHLSSIGLPIVKDDRYSRGNRAASELPEGAPALTRQALHARDLTLAHPATAERMTFSAPVADDIKALVEWLRRERKLGAEDVSP